MTGVFFEISLMPLASRPRQGFTQINIFLPCKKARAIANRCLLPPDRFPTLSARLHGWISNSDSTLRRLSRNEGDLNLKSGLIDRIPILDNSRFCSMLHPRAKPRSARFPRQLISLA